MGADGANAKLLYLTASAENMAFNADDTPKTTQTINISAKLQNVTGTATFTAIPYIGNTAQSAITLGGTGNTRTLTSSQWTNKDWTLIAITATLDNLSDTLSIVKVKDGKEGETFYPHRGYLMADNTLVNQVPNTNDLRIAQSKFFAYQGSTVSRTEGVSVPEWSATDAIRHVISGGTGGGVAGTMSTGVLVKANVKYVHSVFIKNQGTTVVRLNNNLSQAIDIQPGETKRVIFNPAGSATGNASKQFVLYRLNASDVQDFILWHPKIEESETTATYWTPSPLDDYENAYPKYEGFYSDTNQAHSTDPDKYKPWTPFMGPQGPAGGVGPTGPPGANAQEVFSGYLTNEAIVLPANSAGTVTDFSAANGTFITFLGQTQQTTGVAYSLVSQSGITANINASTGVYTVTAASADMGMAIFRAVRNGVTIQKQIIVTKSKQGSAGNGVISTDITYQVGSSGTTTPTGNWLSAIPTVPAGQFLWTRTIWMFSDSTSKTGYSVSKSGETGATGNGISATSINYVASTSGTTVPTSGWTAAIPTVSEGQYLWTRTRHTYTNGNTNESYTVSKQGQKGDPTGLVAQSTVPTSPYVGMLWRNTGTNNGYLLNGTYRWNGSAWEIYVFIAANISVENLAAIVSRIGEIYNDYSRTYNDNTTAIGTLSIKDAEINNSGVIRNSSGVVTQSYEQILSHQLLSMARYSGSAAGDQNELIASASLSFDTLTLNDRANGFSGMIHARQLTDTPWINLPYAAGFRTSENNPCQYQISYNMKGKRTITFRGQVERTSGAMTGTTYPFGIGTVPASIRPTENTFKLAAGDATELQTVRVAMLGTAQPGVGNSIQIKVVGNSQYVDISA
ncbi:hypothetical protein ACFDAA_19490, partial [Enterococcus casseliflavus]